jgi:hypothetical protein
VKTVFFTFKVKMPSQDLPAGVMTVFSLKGKKPSQDLPAGVITVFSLKGKKPRPASTTSRHIRLP